MLFHKISAGIILVLLISGCTTTDRKQTQLEGAALGCSAGAIVGQLIGQNSKATAIGCVVMGLTGAAYGKHVADQKENYASREAHFKAVIQNASQVRIEAESYNKQLNSQIIEIRDETTKLKKASENLYSKNIKINQQSQKVTALIKQAEEKRTALRWELSKQKSFLAANQHDIDPNLIQASYSEINQLESERRALEIALAELKSIDSRRAYQ